MNIGDIIELTAFDISFEGKGVCKYNDKVVFVDNLVVGETGKVKIIKNSKKFSFGEVVEITQPSSYRETPKCELYEVCGGCTISHLNDELKKQVKLKTVQNLAKNLDVDVVDCIENVNDLGYRNKVVMHAARIGGKVVCGPYSSKTRTVVGNDCLMMSDGTRGLHIFIQNLLNEYNVSVYDYNTKLGCLKNIVYRMNDNNEVMVVFVVVNEDVSIELVIEEIANLEMVCSVYVNRVSSNSKNILGKEETCYAGETKILNNIGDLTFELLPQSFFQINNKVSKKMFDEIKRIGKFDGSETVLDAYCGVGAIGLSIASSVKSVVGIDINESSIENANNNLVRNNIENASFVCGDIFEVLDDSKIEFDVVIIDPPRSGCSKEFINHIVEKKYEKVIYMSCNPSTLTRDLKILKEYGYNAKEIEVFDMFPHTSHVETLVLLTR